MSTHAFPDKASTRAWIKSYVSELKRPCLVKLKGDLGAGKTQFVRWFLEDLGAKGVASPTFAIHLRYETAGGPVDHVDLYRVKDDDDLEASGFWDLFREPRGLVFVEWADRLPESVWPRDWTRVDLHLGKSDASEARELKIEVIPAKI